MRVRHSPSAVIKPVQLDPEASRSPPLGRKVPPMLSHKEVSLDLLASVCEIFKNQSSASLPDEVPSSSTPSLTAAVSASDLPIPPPVSAENSVSVSRKHSEEASPDVVPLNSGVSMTAVIEELVQQDSEMVKPQVQRDNDLNESQRTLVSHQQPSDAFASLPPLPTGSSLGPEAQAFLGHPFLSMPSMTSFQNMGSHTSESDNSVADQTSIPSVPSISSMGAGLHMPPTPLSGPQDPFIGGQNSFQLPPGFVLPPGLQFVQMNGQVGVTMMGPAPGMHQGPPFGQHFQHGSMHGVQDMQGMQSTHGMHGMPPSMQHFNLPASGMHGMGQGMVGVQYGQANGEMPMGFTATVKHDSQRVGGGPDRDTIDKRRSTQQLYRQKRKAGGGTMCPVTGRMYADIWGLRRHWEKAKCPCNQLPRP